MAQRVGRGIALLFHDRGTRRGWVVSSTPRPHFTPGKDPVLILQEAGWAPGPVWTGRKSRLYRDSIPDRPERGQSLYRLSYRAHIPLYNTQIKWGRRTHSATGWMTEELWFDSQQRQNVQIKPRFHSFYYVQIKPRFHPFYYVQIKPRFHPFYYVQIKRRFHPFSYSVGTGADFAGSKVAVSWNGPPTHV